MTRVCLHTKEWGLGRPWAADRTKGIFKGSKKESLYSDSRNVQKIKLETESDHNGDLAHSSIAVIFGNFRIL